MTVYGITGWKNCGKTGLTERLVAEFRRRGLTVATVKHAHHRALIDTPGTDSARHRDAGAGQVILATPTHWALMTQLDGAPEPPLSHLLARLDPHDLVLVEGYKSAPHPKIECHRAAAGRKPLIADTNPTVHAVATDTALTTALPQLDLNDTAAIADFIWAEIAP